MNLYNFENAFDVSEEEENDYVFNKFVVKTKEGQWVLIDIYGNTFSFDGKTVGSIHWVKNPDHIFEFLKKRITEKYSDYKIGIREQKEYWVDRYNEYIGVDVKFTLFKEMFDGKRQYKLLTIHDIDMSFLKLGSRLISMDKIYIATLSQSTMNDRVTRSKKDSGNQIRSLGQYNGFVVDLNDEEINSPDDAIVYYFKKLIEKENVISVGIIDVGVLHDIDNVVVVFHVNFSM